MLWPSREAPPDGYVLSCIRDGPGQYRMEAVRTAGLCGTTPILMVSKMIEAGELAVYPEGAEGLPRNVVPFPFSDTKP